MIKIPILSMVVMEISTPVTIRLTNQSVFLENMYLHALHTRAHHKGEGIIIYTLPCHVGLPTVTTYTTVTITIHESQ